jgi:hypothetical protein
MMEEEFTDFLYTVGERTFVCGNGNNGYLDMVINKKRGWVIEIEGCSCETGRGEKDSNGSKGEKKGK